MSELEAIVADTGRRKAEIVVLDNRDRKHTLVVDTQGTIHDHETGAYAETPADRTPVENELVAQARRYARNVMVEELDQVSAKPFRLHPDQIEATMRVLERVPDDQFDEYFRPLARQLASHVTDEVERPIELPPTVPEDALVVYRVNLYVDVANDVSQSELSGLFDAMGGAMVENQLESLFGGSGSTGLDFVRDVGRTAAQRGTDPVELFDIVARSGIQPVVHHPDGRVQELPYDGHTGAEPLARVELAPFEPGGRESFREFLMYHLLCQARDASLRMGVEPADEHMKVTGPGLHHCTQRYRTLDCYEDYHDPDAQIDSWDPQDAVK